MPPTTRGQTAKHHGLYIVVHWACLFLVTLKTESREILPHAEYKSKNDAKQLQG